LQQIRIMRDTAAMEGRPPQALVYCLPEDQLAKVVRNLFDRRCSRAPILSCHPGDLEVPSVLHMATMGGILACLMRHFRASLASLPLLSQPLGALPIGTWSPDCQGLAPVDEAVAMEAAGSSSSGGNGSAGGAAGGGEAGRGARRAGRHVRKLHTVTPATPLTTALALLLEAGVSWDALEQPQCRWSWGVGMGSWKGVVCGCCCMGGLHWGTYWPQELVHMVRPD
jgi:hypothetical protein